MIINEFLLGILVHVVKGVEGSLKVSLEGVACLYDLSHNLIPLFIGNGRSEREAIKVSSNSDPSAHNHCCIFS